ncbi:MAG: MerR family transcriptional regulator [Bryobacteraceae bacterium]
MARAGQPIDSSGVADDEPCYVISIAARLVGVHQQTLRYYERAGLLEPKRTVGNIRMYSNSDIQRIRQIQRWMDEFGVNLAGAEIMFRMTQQIKDLHEKLSFMQNEVDRLRSTRLPAPYRGAPLPD